MQQRTEREKPLQQASRELHGQLLGLRTAQSRGVTHVSHSVDGSHGAPKEATLRGAEDVL